MLRIIDEKNDVNLECDDLYAIVLHEKDGIRFLSNAKNYYDIIAAAGAFLAAAIKASIERGLKPQQSKAVFANVVYQLFRKSDLIQQYLEKNNDIEDDKKNGQDGVQKNSITEREKILINKKIYMSFSVGGNDLNEPLFMSPYFNKKTLTKEQMADFLAEQKRNETELSKFNEFDYGSTGPDDRYDDGDDVYRRGNEYFWKK